MHCLYWICTSVGSVCFLYAYLPDQQKKEHEKQEKTENFIDFSEGRFVRFSCFFFLQIFLELINVFTYHVIKQTLSLSLCDPDCEWFLAGKGSSNATTAAPAVRPGQRRTAEMKLLYGKGAAMIHGMETAMQLNYDRQLDLKQPKHWPHLPLNITFG